MDAHLCEGCKRKVIEGEGEITLCRKCADELSKVAGASIGQLVTITRNHEKESMSGMNPFDDERQELLRWRTIIDTLASLIVDLKLAEESDGMVMDKAGWLKQLAHMRNIGNDLTRELAELDTFAAHGVEAIRPIFSSGKFETADPGDFGMDFDSSYPVGPVGAGSIAADILRARARHGRKADTLRVSAHFFDSLCNRWIYNCGREQDGVRLLRLFTWSLDPQATFTRIGLVGKKDAIALIGKAPVNFWYSVLSPTAFNMVIKANGTHYINQEISGMASMVMNESSRNSINVPSFNASDTLEFEWQGKVDGIAIVTAHAE